MTDVIADVEIKKENSLMYLFQKDWKYSEGNRRNVIIYWIQFIVSNVIVLIIYPFLIAYLMNIIQKQGITWGNIHTLMWCLFGMFISNQVFWLFHGRGRIKEMDNAFYSDANYCIRLVTGVLRLPLAWHSDHKSGDSIDKINKGTDALFDFSSNSFTTIMSGVRLIVSFIVICYLSWISGIVIFLTILLAAWITIRFDKVIMAKHDEYNLLQNEIVADIFDAISNVTTVIILRAEKRFSEAIARKILAPRALYAGISTANEIKWYLVSTCCSIMRALVLGIYFWQSLRSGNPVALGSVFLLSNYLDTLDNIFFDFADKYSQIVKYHSKVLSSEMICKDFAIDIEASLVEEQTLPHDWKKVQIKELNFSYHTQEGRELHLKDISFEFRKGEKIAIVGGSGDGKTSFLLLFRSLYYPESVNVICDGLQLPSGLAGFKGSVSLIPQAPEIFASTIEENMTMGESYTQEELDMCIEIACFREVLDKLPLGLKTKIGEKGVKLSGGQRQRLALVRGLLASLRDKSIIALDEATASVDSTAEKQIHLKMFKAFKDRTVICSTHRLHLLPLFDRIYVFGKGKIVASGTLTELLTSCPEFQELWKNSRSES